LTIFPIKKVDDYKKTF